MAENLDGKITFNKKGQRHLEFTTVKGRKINLIPSAEILSPQIKAKKDVEVIVKVDTGADGRPTKVYLESESWSPPKITSSKPIDYQKVRKEGAWRTVERKPLEGRKFSRMKDSYSGRKREEIEIMKPEFHNPYNFVPALPRKKKEDFSDLDKEEGKLARQLCDDAPSGHDRYQSDKYSGQLHVQMIVETPLLLLDTARMGFDKNKKHKTYPVRVGRDEKPEINSTAVKGMLRSAYEAITNSRFSVFKNHDERLAHRPQAKTGVNLIPARIVADEKKVILLKGTSKFDGKEITEKHKEFPALFAAWLHRYKKQKPKNENTPELDGGVKGEHGKPVWAYITRWEYRKKKYPYTKFDFWNVVELLPRTDNKPTEPSKKCERTSWDNAQPAKKAEGQWVEGFICNTNSNIQNKHDERVFFSTKDNLEEEVVLSEKDWEELRTKWKELINNYRKTHEESDGKLESPPKNKKTGKPLFLWSRQIQLAKKERELKNGTLCYAQVEYQKGQLKILELFPVMISRKLYDKPPEDLLPASLKPADNIERLSPADRVFGWVGQGVKKIGGYRGQIRISSITCLTEKENAIEIFPESLPLQILGQPKPQQGRFYVARNRNGDAQPDGLTGEQTGYSRLTDYPEKLLKIVKENDKEKLKEKKGLRGRKVYPHHANLPVNGYWFEEDKGKKGEFKDNSLDYTQKAVDGENGRFFREYLRPKKLNEKTGRTEQQRDSQNRSVEGWIKKGTEFSFDVHFTNLSEVELGALIWLLDLNRYVNTNSESRQFFHRFGGGKPLGFGSVKLILVEEAEVASRKRGKVSDIRSGKELKLTRYSSLDDDKFVFNFAEIGKNFIKPFEDAIKISYGKENKNGSDKQFAETSFIKAFLRASEGFVNDNPSLPIHYPRARHYKEKGFGREKRVIINHSRNTPLPPHSEGLAYEWFVENDKEKLSDPESQKLLETRLSLPDIENDKGLPILPHKKQFRS